MYIYLHSNKVKILPDLFNQFVQVPFEMSRARDTVGDSIKDIELLDSDLVDLIEDIDAGDIKSVAFDDINQFIHCSVAAEADIRIRDLVLVEHGLHSLLVDVSQIDSLGDADTALLFLLERNVGGLLVEPDPEPLELLLNEFLVGHRLERVENDQNEVASASNSNNLLTTTLAVLGTLDDTGKIEELDTRTLVVDNARHAGKGGEFVGSDRRVGVGELVQQSGLADAREPYKAHTRVTGLCNVETFASTTARPLAAG